MITDIDKWLDENPSIPYDRAEVSRYVIDLMATDSRNLLISLGDFPLSQVAWGCIRNRINIMMGSNGLYHVVFLVTPGNIHQWAASLLQDFLHRPGFEVYKLSEIPQSFCLISDREHGIIGDALKCRTFSDPGIAETARHIASYEIDKTSVLDKVRPTKSKEESEKIVARLREDALTRVIRSIWRAPE